MGENNKATVVGRFTKGFTYSYCMHGENFYTTEIAAERLSGNYDYIPVTISEHLIDVREDFTGEPVELVGDFRSYNKQGKNRSHLILTLMAQEITFVDEEAFPDDKIFLDGFICKPPTYRRTPLGREIAEILLAEQALRKIRLYTVYLLGKKCKMGKETSGWNWAYHTWKNPEPGIWKRTKNGI